MPLRRPGGGRPEEPSTNWAEQILAYHTTGKASNGRVENTHMLAEKIRRTGHGFTNHDNYRRRLIGLFRLERGVRGA